jgi:hypothetical protein
MAGAGQPSRGLLIGQGQQDETNHHAGQGRSGPEQIEGRYTGCWTLRKTESGSRERSDGHHGRGDSAERKTGEQQPTGSRGQSSQVEMVAVHPSANAPLPTDHDRC